MSHHEKRHRTTIQHLRYLKSFMDEIDREVMSLTDRAFKSLCIGDEAIYNDSEFSPSGVSCHKPMVEDVSKKSQENSLSAGNKHKALPLNGGGSKLSKDSGLFAFATTKNGESTKVTNGDSWDKSALLSIQRELSEFSSSCLTDDHLSPAKNLDEGSSNKPSKDDCVSSAKTLKAKQCKNSKLKKLNCINFFLHSEFSPFLSWREFNTFSIGREHISQILSNNRPPEWYDSPLYKELTAVHGRLKQNLPISVGKQSPKQRQTPSSEPDPPPLESTAPTIGQKSDVESENIQRIIPSKAPPLATEQRCNSERAEPLAPWRKSRSRAKSAAPLEHSFTNSPVYERTSAWERDRKTFKNDVKTIEDPTSASSTPFSISQLLTPVIPSRHGTGTSEILQTVLSPSLDILALPERDLHPSPEIKREGYKSIASSLLFNIKDNRKRVKTMYSPAKFKGLDGTNQNKESPLSDLSNNCLEVPEISEPKTVSPSRQKAIFTTMSPLLETADAKTCISPKGPDDYLGLSLLQPGKVKSNRSPSASKAAYPSLQLYRKNNTEERRTNSQTPSGTSAQVCKDKPTSDPVMEHSQVLVKDEEKQSSNSQSEMRLNNKELPAALKGESMPFKNSGKDRSESLPNPEKQTVGNGFGEMGRSSSRGLVSAQKSPVKEKEADRKGAGAKHAFSAQLNNYIKSQRFASTDEDNHGDDYNIVKDLLTVNNKNSSIDMSEFSKMEKTGKIKVDLLRMKQKEKELPKNVIESEVLMGNVRGESLSAEDQTIPVALANQREKTSNLETMKGNTSAKRALFFSKEQGFSKTNAHSKKENAVFDKYDLAKMALEEVIADREQRKLKTKNVLAAEGSVVDRKQVGCKVHQGGIVSPSLEQKPIFGEFLWNEIGGNTKGVKGQNTVSALKTNQQMVTEEMAKHGESHVPGVKLARTCKHEASSGQSQHSEPIKHRETDRLCLDSQERNTDHESKRNRTCQQELIHENMVDAMKSTKPRDGLQSKNVDIKGQDGEKTSVGKKECSFKPEIPPRRGRSNSQSTSEKTESKLEFLEGDIEVKKMEIENIEDVKPNQSKIKGPVRGNVSALKEKYGSRPKMNQKDNKKDRSVESAVSEQSRKEDIDENAPLHKVEHKFVPPKLTISDPDNHTFSVVSNHVDTEADRLSNSSPRESLKDEEHEKLCTTQLSPKDARQSESIGNDGVQEKIRNNEGKEADSSLKDSHKTKGASKSYVKDFLSGLLGFSSSEKTKAVEQTEEELSESLSSESSKRDQGRKDSITIYDILENAPSVSSPNGTLSNYESVSSNTSEPSLLNTSESVEQTQELLKTEVICNIKKVDDGNVKGNIQEIMLNCCSVSVHEGGAVVSDMVGSPARDLDKMGWVHNLIESARDLTQLPENNSSSKDEEEISLRLLEKDHCIGSENKDQDLIKDCTSSLVENSTMSIKSHHPNQPPMHFLALPATGKERKLSAGSVSMSEEEERFSAVSTLSEGVDSYETSQGDSLEENPPTEDVETSREVNEISPSAASGIDVHDPNKPPVVPPKTEKALRRAMKLTNRRIQKAEAKSKCERKGRSGDKSGKHKTEKRLHATDKAHDRPEQRSLSSDRINSKRGEPLETFEVKSHKSDKHVKSDHDLKSRNVQEEEMTVLSSINHLEQNGTSNLQDPLTNGHLGKDKDRLGRSDERCLHRKLERRTQSLDRFLRDNPESVLGHPGKLPEIATDESKYSNPKASPVRHHSIEHTYAPVNNLVPQSFPMTQRKLLQDPDSGQYFLVDMPVQVKTKTFFDPETRTYVQLPVQSPESAVRHAQSLEVMNTPLMVFHGFVPMPVPSQKSIVRTQESLNLPDHLTDFEPSKDQIPKHFSQTENGERNPYIKPLYVTQEHTPEEEIDSVR